MQETEFFRYLEEHITDEYLILEASLTGAISFVQEVAPIVWTLFSDSKV